MNLKIDPMPETAIDALRELLLDLSTYSIETLAYVRGFIDGRPNIGTFQGERTGAADCLAGEEPVVLKPSDALLDALAAVRAMKRKREFLDAANES